MEILAYGKPKFYNLKQSMEFRIELQNSELMNQKQYYSVVSDKADKVSACLLVFWEHLSFE